jgi:class 3 adenylate cyclase
MPIQVLELHRHAMRVAGSSQAAAAALDFYQNVLGLARDDQHPTLPGTTAYWLAAGDHAQLQFVAAGGSSLAPDVGFDPALPHVAFAVADIVAAKAELGQRGIPYNCLPGSIGPRFERVLLRDPAGNLIELHQIGTCRCERRSRTGIAHARVFGAVMFADMRGFTGLSERLNPGDVVPLLNEYFELLTDITLRHGGTVFHLAGDGLMAGFGVPTSHDDAPGRAVDAAREMLGEFRDLAHDWRRRLAVETGLGIGINAGEMIAGDVGSPQHHSYTIVGDTVNVAAHLSQRARAGEVLFSAAVKESLGGSRRNLPVVGLPALKLRGRAAPVEIYCLPCAERIDFRAFDAPAAAAL